MRVGPSSCRVEFSVPAALVAVVSAASASVSQPRSLFTAVTGPPSPCFGSQPRLYWTAQAHLVGSKGMSLKNNQTLPRGSEWGVPGWSRSSRLSTCPLTPSSVPRHSLGYLAVGAGSAGGLAWWGSLCSSVLGRPLDSDLSWILLCAGLSLGPCLTPSPGICWAGWWGPLQFQARP